MAKRGLAVAPMLLAVALVLLLASCHGKELKENDGAGGAAGGAAGAATGAAGVDDAKTLGLPVPLVPNLPLVPLPPVTGPLIPGTPPAARASTDNDKSP